MMGVRAPVVGRKADLGFACGWLNVDDSEGGKIGFCLLVDGNGVACCWR